MTVQTKTKIKRYSIYVLMLILASIFQNTLQIFPEIFKVRPVILISVAVCIAMFEGEVVGAVAGLLAGALWDTVTVSADGYNALYLMLTCAICGMLLRVFMRNNIVTYTIMNSIITIVYFLFYALFFVSARGIDGAIFMIVRFYLPMAVYSILLTPLWYYLIRTVNRKFSSDYMTV